MAVQPIDQFVSGVTAELYRAAIGPRGQDYYLRHFTRFDANGKTAASWHWPAYWSTLNWLIYRKMWGWALAYAAALVGMALVIFGVGKLLLNYSDTTGLLLFLAFLAAAFVLPGLYANAWYYSYCNEKISSVLRETRDVNEARAALAAQASTERRRLALVIANAAVLALAGGVAVSMLNDESHAARLAQSLQDKPQEGDKAVEPAWPVVATSAMSHKTASAMPAQAEPKLAPPVPVPVPTQSDASATPAKEAPASKPVQPPQPAALQLAAAAGEQEAAPPAKKAKAAPSDAARPAKRKYIWFVQVGAFASEENVQNARLKVEQMGLETSAEPVDTPAGRLQRVRAGPFDKKVEAERAALRIKTLDLPALLIRQ
jgi:cell division septation protein DedD